MVQRVMSIMVVFDLIRNIECELFSVFHFFSIGQPLSIDFFLCGFSIVPYTFGLSLCE